MRIVEEFRIYLETLQYSKQICYELPNTILRFMAYVKYTKCKSLSMVSKSDIEDYVFYVANTVSKKTNRKLSVIQINGYIYALKHFSKFLHNVHSIDFAAGHIDYYKDTNKTIRQPLSLHEVKQLFAATDGTKYGMRDRAMLTLFYSCGLRRNEGVNVQTTDIDLQKKLVFVRKGKFGKQRYVPFTELSKQYLEEYLTAGRRQFLTKANPKIRKTLFISKHGEALKDYSLLVQLKTLAHKAGVNNRVGLHILRHSIATHLLQGGMKIHDISQFLGHSSLASTQIYTHIRADEVL